MFPLQQGNELCFQISSSTHNEIPQDLITSHPALYGSTDVADDLGKSRRRKSISMDNDQSARDNSNDKKKLLHRDIERQRRQEMTTLYASLRSLLPLEYIKGKRSISDHMNEAVNYIKHLKKRIKELDSKRDELKKKTNFRNIPIQSSGSSNNCSLSTGFIIRPCLSGIQIVFSSGFGEQSSSLSRALQLLLEAEISVVSCVSTKVNERVYHTIHAEVKDSTCVNLSELQQKLNPLVP